MAFASESEPLTQIYIDRLKAGTQRTYYRGIIQYKDIFGINRHTGFCAYYPGTTRSVPFLECPHGNYMD
jgi:hypothetical protein